MGDGTGVIKANLFEATHLRSSTFSTRKDISSENRQCVDGGRGMAEIELRPARCQGCGVAFELLPLPDNFAARITDLRKLCAEVNNTKEPLSDPELLLDIAESRSGLEHLSKICADEANEVQPLCDTCAKEQSVKMERALGRAKITQKRYQDFLIKCKEYDSQREKAQGTECDEDMAKIAELEQQVANLEQNLTETSQQRAAIHGRMGGLRHDIRNLELESNRCWDKVVSHELVLEEMTQRARSLSTRQQQLNQKLERLKHTNVCNDAFFIWFDGPFGTINGFRLGRLPSQPVEYAEINAAWGQAAMLLATIEKRHKGFKFQRFRVVPMGSYSRLGPHGDLSHPLPLHWDGGSWRKTSYNRAMAAFLSCLDELGIYASAHDRTIQMPYAIKGKIIGDHSIELGDWYNWTCALKYLLTNLKWLVAWSSKTR